MSAWDEIDKLKATVLRFKPDSCAMTPGISPDRARTMKAEDRIRRGIHPINGRPLKLEPTTAERGATCGNCKHLREKETPARAKHFKCALYGDTNGPGTDIRKKWPACDLWEVKP